MALAGSAIGLGNIWRFPYMVGEYGGAAFIIVYALCGILISLPIMFCESVIGRRARSGVYEAFDKMVPGTPWKYFGFITVLASFIIVSYYCVVGGWSFDYLVRSCAAGFEVTTPEQASTFFGTFASSPWEPMIAFTIFLGISGVIVMRGVKGGIEKFTKVSTPMLFVLIVMIAIFSVSLPGAGAGVDYLLKPDFSKLTPTSVSYALGQSFFSMSLGVGCVLTYSSFMKKEDSIVAAGGWTFVFDTLFALIAGFAIMPAVFSAGIEPGAGPSLVFETLPYIFAKMGAAAPIVSRIESILFFLAIFMAALTSSISMFEVCVEHFVDRRGWSRRKASALLFICAWTLGALCCLSFGPLKDISLMGHSIFSFCDTLTSNYAMTLGALVFSLFVGWKMDRSEVREELTNGGTHRFSVRIFNVIHFLIKWVVPVMILTIFLTNLFL